MLQLQTNPSWFRPQRENFKVSHGQTTTLPPMRGHEGAVGTQLCTVFEMRERSEHLDCWTWAAGVWDFLEQNLNPVYPLYCNTLGNYAFSPNGKEKYFQEKLTVFYEEVICKCRCNWPCSSLQQKFHLLHMYFTIGLCLLYIKVLSWTLNLPFCEVSSCSTLMVSNSPCSNLTVPEFQEFSGRYHMRVVTWYKQPTASRCWKTWKGIKEQIEN